MTNLTAKRLKIIGLVIIIILAVSIGSLLVYSNQALYAKVTSFVYKVVELGEYTETISYTNPHHFSYNLTKIDVDRKGATLINNYDQADIILLNALKINPDSTIVGFKENAIKGRGSQITYQLTSDYKAWYYFDGNNWVTAGECVDCVNNVIEINKNISKFPVSSSGIQIKAFLSAKDQPVTLKSIELEIRGKELDLVDNAKRKAFFAKTTLAVPSGEEKVTICHRTGSITNPYNIISVKVSAIGSGGANDHSQHVVDTKNSYGDVIFQDEFGNFIDVPDGNGDGVVDELDCLSQCGDGIWNSNAETCDPEAAPTGCGEGYFCNDVCLCLESEGECGNEVVEPGEECELDEDCAQGEICVDCLCETAAYCGDGIIDPEEECEYDEDCPDNGFCVDCICEYDQPYCGNGMIDPGEECEYDEDCPDNGFCVGCLCEYEGPICGDNILDDGEECDDGNNNSGDGCNADCTIPDNCNDVCTYEIGCGGGLSCYQEHCRNDACLFEADCICPNCGDGNLDQGEECDDGNNIDDDGCSSYCLNEYCGDNVVQTGLGEECDDGNNDDGDGCSSDCLTEVEPGCGNSILEEGEDCDDGNNLPGDGCAPDCTLEGNVPICHATGSQSHPYNVLWVDPSAIDGQGANDHTNHPGDIIPIWDVNADGEIDMQDCIESQYQCGNSILDPGEECDDGNNLDGDGCSAECKIWDGSDIDVDGECFASEQSSNAVFIITNYGEPVVGDMTEPREYRIYRDGVLITTSTFQLAGGQSTLPISVSAGEGVTIRLEADQHPAHPNVDPQDPSSYYVFAEIIDCYEPLAPIARDDQAETFMTTSVLIDILANDEGRENPLDPSSVTITTPPSNGTIDNINPATGVVTYTPGPGFYGQDTFVYQVCDTSIPPLCDTALVTIDVYAGPMANNDSDETIMGQPVTVDVLANDIDLDGTLVPSTVALMPGTGPDNGSIVIDSGTGEITYTPSPGFYGIDNFDYEVCDNDGYCDTATVTILVKAPPIANDDSASADQAVPKIIEILDNDSDPDGTLVISTGSITIPPSHGTAVYNTSTGAVTYTSFSGYIGLDYFTYEICDNDGLCDTAEVTVGVASLIPPTANDDSTSITHKESAEDDVSVEIDVLDNDEDVDGTLEPSSVIITSYPSGGTVTINSETGVITYTPNICYSGTDTFIYRVCDDDDLCDTATVSVNVNALPIAVDDSASTEVNTPVDIDVVANDSDPDGSIDPTTVLITSLPSHGLAVVNPVTGVVTYDPDIDYIGIDTFEYQVCDNDGDCDTALVTVNVTPELLPPVAEDDSTSTAKNSSVVITVLGNDSDPDGSIDPTTVAVLSGPDHGSVFVDPVSGQVTYTPDTDYVGPDIFTYEVCDNDGLCDTADVFITVTSGGGPTPTQNPPVAINDNASTPYQTAVQINVLANDSDPDDNLDMNSLLVIAPPSHGIIAIDSMTMIVTYTPDLGFSGTDNFVYLVCDTTSLCDTATVIVNVAGPPGGPTPEPECGNGVLESGEQCDDGNTRSGDGCSASCTIEGVPGSICGNGILESGEQCDDGNTTSGDGCSAACTLEGPPPPTPPLVVPPAVIPPPPLPPVSPTLGVFDPFCAGRLYTTGDITFVGEAGLPPGDISSLQYSFDTGGASWNTFSNYTAVGAGAIFNFTLNGITTGSHSVIVRANYTDGTSAISPTCDFNINLGLIFGANQFVTPQ